MRKLINPGANGGAPIYLGDLINLTQDEQWDVIQGMAQAMTRELTLNSVIYNSGIVISGLVVSGRDDVLQTASYTAGIVYIDGQFLRVPAYAGNYNVSIEKSGATNTSRTFKDGSSKAIIREYKGSIVLFAATTAAVYMHPDFIDDYRLIGHIHGRGQWQNVTLANGWVASASSRAPQYRLGRDRKVHFRGAISHAAATNDTFGTLATEFRPNNNVRLGAHSFGGVAPENRLLTVTSAGVSSIVRTGTNTDVSLEGLCFDLL
jgi:hypothetical protein